MRKDRINNKCDRCDAVAEYDNPFQACRQHWAEWWTDGLMDGQEIAGGYTREELLKETLADIEEMNSKKE